MNYETLLQKTIFPELEKGRPNWDKPHTQAVVQHLKTIINNSPELNLDFDVLLIAAYAHDWGYAGLFKDGKQLSIADVNDAKSAHMTIGVKKLTKLLSNPTFDFLSSERKQRATHLVKIHDKIDELTDSDELVLMEADTLGGLDIEKVKPSFDLDSNTKYMIGVKNHRFPKFITKCGKEQFEKLYQMRADYYLNQTIVSLDCHFERM